MRMRLNACDSLLRYCLNKNYRISILGAMTVLSFLFNILLGMHVQVLGTIICQMNLNDD